MFLCQAPSRGADGGPAAWVRVVNRFPAGRGILSSERPRLFANHGRLTSEGRAQRPADLEHAAWTEPAVGCSTNRGGNRRDRARVEPSRQHVAREHEDRAAHPDGGHGSATRRLHGDRSETGGPPAPRFREVGGWLAACGETQAAQFSRWGLERRSIPAEPLRFAPFCVAFRSKYTRYSSLARLVSRAPRPHRENWPLSALTRVPPQAASPADPEADCECAVRGRGRNRDRR